MACPCTRSALAPDVAAFQRSAGPRRRARAASSTTRPRRSRQGRRGRTTRHLHARTRARPGVPAGERARSSCSLAWASMAGRARPIRGPRPRRRRRGFFSASYARRADSGPDTSHAWARQDHAECSRPPARAAQHIVSMALDNHFARGALQRRQARRGGFALRVMLRATAPSVPRWRSAGARRRRRRS